MPAMNTPTRLILSTFKIPLALTLLTTQLWSTKVFIQYNSCYKTYTLEYQIFDSVLDSIEKTGTHADTLTSLKKARENFVDPDGENDSLKEYLDRRIEEYSSLLGKDTNRFIGEYFQSVIEKNTKS